MAAGVCTYNPQVITNLIILTKCSSLPDLRSIFSEITRLEKEALQQMGIGTGRERQNNSFLSGSTFTFTIQVKAFLLILIK
jgi:hypothetical protein